MSSIRWLPFFMVGGFGLGSWFAGNYKAATIQLGIAFILAFFNRLIDIWTIR